MGEALYRELPVKKASGFRPISNCISSMLYFLEWFGCIERV